MSWWIFRLATNGTIICAEHVHADWIVQNIDKAYLNKIEIIELGDTEQFMSKSLIEMLETKMEGRFELFSHDKTSGRSYKTQNK